MKIKILLFVALSWVVFFVCVWFLKLFYNETISEEGDKKGFIICIMFVVICILISIVYNLVPNINNSVFASLILFLLSILLFGFWAMSCDGYGKKIKEQQEEISKLKNKLKIKEEESKK